MVKPASSHAILDSFLQRPGLLCHFRCNLQEGLPTTPMPMTSLKDPPKGPSKGEWFQWMSRGPPGKYDVCFCWKLGKPWSFFWKEFSLVIFILVVVWDNGLWVLCFFLFFCYGLSQIISIWYPIEPINSSQLLSNCRRSSDTQHFNKYQLHIDKVNRVTQPFPIWVVIL